MEIFLYKWKVPLQKEMSALFLKLLLCLLVLKIIQMPKRQILGWQIMGPFSTFQLQNLGWL